MATAKKTTKAKTVPAKKPAKKPAGKSIKPKATKVVKTNTTSQPKATAKTNRSTGKIIFSVIIAILVVAVATMAVVGVVCSLTSTVMIENGNHTEISAKYTRLNNGSYRILVPSSLKKVSAEELKNTYDADDTIEAIYANDESTVSIAVSKPNAELSNDQIPTYLDTMKSIFSVSGKVIDSKLETIEDHNVGSIKLTLSADGITTYNELAFFSYDGKLVVMTFSCRDDLRTEWEPVGDKIIDSIDFLK